MGAAWDQRANYRDVANGREGGTTVQKLFLKMWQVFIGKF